MPYPMKNQFLRFLALLAWWLSVAIFATEQTIAMANSSGQPRTWAEILPLQLAGWLLWVPLTAFLMILVSRYPFSSRSKFVSIFALSFGVLLCCIAKAVLVFVLNGDSGFWYDAPVSFGAMLLDSVRNNFVLSWLIIGVAHAYYYYDHDKQNQILVAQLQAGLNKGQLEALAARLNPHFMFNTLNAIMELVHTDPDGAESMLQGLSSLLRRSLDTGGPALVTVREELEFIDQYVAIQTVRFGDRLSYQAKIELPALTCPIPMMLLQPLIENAVEHGVAVSAQPSTVVLNGRVSNQSLVLSVDSPFVKGKQTQGGFGIGLSATEARLRLVYGDQQTLNVTYDQLDRILVTIVIISNDFLPGMAASSSSAKQKSGVMDDE
jgi:Histidine kinase